jgi:hypothetical protein
MRPRKQSYGSWADEACLACLADQAIEQWPTIYERLSNPSASEFSTDSDESTIFDLYLLVYFWCYTRSSKFDLRIPLSAFLYQLPFDAYSVLSLQVHFVSCSVDLYSEAL